MNYYLMPFAVDGNIDPTVEHGILDHLPTRVQSESQADCVIVVVSYVGDYKFNPMLAKVRKPVILLDFIEGGWDAGEKPNLLGYSLQDFGHLNTPEWARLTQWVRDIEPRLYFKRELHRRDRVSNRAPIEYPCRMEVPPLQSKEEFNARPIEVFSSWGLSNPSRQRLHGDIFRRAHDTGIHVVDAWDQDNRFEGRTWATIHSPWFNRKPLEEVMRWQRRAKISVSMPGAGVKCFRSAESPVDSIMALHEDSLAWSFPWTHLENCIRLEPGNEFNSLYKVASLNMLYDTYCASRENILRYTSERYAREYLLPLISARL